MEMDAPPERRRALVFANAHYDDVPRGRGQLLERVVDYYQFTFPALSLAGVVRYLTWGHRAGTRD
jgi:hypothetical protein